MLSTKWHFNNSCANLYYNRTDTIVDIYISTKFIAFVYRTDTKVEIMFKFTSKFSDDFKTEASILNPVLPDDYSFKVVKQSAIVGETQFTLECRVNVIDKLLLDIGRKSGTTYNKLRGDRQGKRTKVIVSGIRKCHHAVKRHQVQVLGDNQVAKRFQGKIHVVLQSCTFRCLVNAFIPLIDTDYPSRNKIKRTTHRNLNWIISITIVSILRTLCGIVQSQKSVRMHLLLSSKTTLRRKKKSAFQQ